MPFTTEQFIQVFEKYNQAIYPMQFLLILVAIASVTLAANPKPSTNKTISGLIGFLWLWVGIVYHLIFFTKTSPPAYLFGTSFVFQGLLFLYKGVVRNLLSFRMSKTFYGILGAILMVYAGNVLDLWKRLNCPTKLIAVDEQADHNIMQQGRFGETNRSAS